MSLPLPAPEPPPDLRRRKLVIEELPAGTPIYRFHTAKYPPTFFDTSQSSRFNSPDGSYGVMYAALERHGAFAETFLRDVGSTAISELFVESKACATYTLTSAIRAIRLRGYGLAPIGATASVCSCPGPPYTLPQAWSAALYNHPEKPNAILYGSRHDDEALCLAIFDRARDALDFPVGVTNLLDQTWFYELMDRYGVGLA
jgi:hypothetical protein